MALIPGNLLPETKQSIESGLDGWDSFSSRSSAIVADTAQSHDGTQSIKCTRNATAGDGAMCGLGGAAQRFACSAGVAYTGTFWVYSSVAASFYMLVDWYQSNNSTYINTTSGNSVTVQANTWTKVGLGGTHTSPALSAFAGIFINNLSGMANGDIAYFDEIYLGVPPPNKSFIRPQAVQRASFW